MRTDGRPARRLLRLRRAQQPRSELRQRDDSIVSPKFSLVLGPWSETEFFFNVGKGFHSNDARGTTIRVDPTDGVTPAERVDPLVDALGVDVGVRTALLPNVQLSRVVVDARARFRAAVRRRCRRHRGEPRERAARRRARRDLESGLVADRRCRSRVVALAVRREFDPAGDRIPGAVENVASVGLAIDHPSGWFGGARFRHFGKAPLIEDDSVRSDPTTLVNLEAGYRITDKRPS